MSVSLVVGTLSYLSLTKLEISPGPGNIYIFFFEVLGHMFLDVPILGPDKYKLST